MTTEGRGHIPPSLEQGLTLLAQFNDERIVLEQTDIELAGVSCSAARHCLLTLSGLGYLTTTHDDGYRLVHADARTPPQGGEDSTASTP